MRSSLPVKHYPVLDSTNEEARRLGLAGERGPLWVFADQQTAGRGRRGRHWQSPVGNLACSGLYHWPGPLAGSAQLGFAAALAVAETLDIWISGAETLSLKWPNDVLLGGAKVAGILLESGVAPGGGHWLAVGVGINLQYAPTDLPYPATCLGDHLRDGKAIPATQSVLDALMTAFEGWRIRLRDEGFAPLRLAWLARAYGLGQPLRTSSDETGVFEDLSSNGALVLRQMSGRSIQVSAGEVFFAD